MNDRLKAGDAPNDRQTRFGGISIEHAHYAALGLLLSAVLIVFAPTFQSMVGTWLSSDTFLHGFLILPTSGYLIWLKRRELRNSTPAGFWPAVPGLLLLSLVWWFAETMSIRVVEQLAATAMVIVAVLATMGARFSGRIAFPLGYLFFAVPIGEALVPYLIDYTAAFTVKALSITGIPVFRDGRYFSIPAGNFEVARACSGIRYLIAALALGTLFSYLMFESTAKRVLFVLFSIVMPIFANGLRAYGIVLLAQYVGIEFAVGVDHIIFGWIFFGFVILLMFVIGSRFSDHRADDALASSGTPGGPHADGKRKPSSIAALFAASAACLAIGPVLAGYDARRHSATEPLTVGLPSSIPGWTGEASMSYDWQPVFRGATHEVYGRYTDGASILDTALVQYRWGQPHDGELASSENAIVDTDVWRIGNMRTVVAHLDSGAEVTINESIVQNSVSTRVVWHWYDVDGHHAASSLRVKLREAGSVIMGGQPVSSAVIVSTTVTGDPESSRDVLRDFVRAAYQPMRECANGPGAECAMNSNRSGDR